ncbi:MAG: hypothetical protein AAFY33_10085 [Cyanobacteria bacterium J06643_4]
MSFGVHNEVSKTFLVSIDYIRRHLSYYISSVNINPIDKRNDDLSA